MRKIKQTNLHLYDLASKLEWLDTNGIGGYASGTVSGANTRRYHGLLVASQTPPVGRRVVLSKMDETVSIGNRKYHLGSNQYPGEVHPQGFQHVKGFTRGMYPVFTYQAGEIELSKTIVAIHGENTVLVIYEVLAAPKKFKLELQPLYSCRDFHSISYANREINPSYTFQKGLFNTTNYAGCPSLYINVPGASFVEKKDWYLNFEYLEEMYRGLDFREDLYTHGKFELSLKKGDKLPIIISTENPTGKDPMKLLAKEKKRREGLLKGLKWNSTLKDLAFSADQFIVKRGHLNTVLAGYHWFADWGRDTMISLPGLCLATGRFTEARDILQEFAENVSEGMIPNRFSDYNETLEYNTIDATLWFFVALHKYNQYTADDKFIAGLMPVLEDIIAWHEKGTRYNIRVDSEDGLLQGGHDGVQLTWMDAKVGDWVVTPRMGKPVEVNALWYNTLCIMEQFMKAQGRSSDAAVYSRKAKVVAKSFNEKFWDETEGRLFDYIDGAYRNEELRPNQIFALSLPFKLLSKERAKKVLGSVTEHLLTIRGLRSLAAHHRDYRPTYGGNIWERDGAYHQGTVWSFLLGPYVDALIHVKGATGKKEATELLEQFFENLDEAGVGTISEIFDGQFPHEPKGCVAQAWGVAEVLRVSVEYGLFNPIAAKEKAVVMA